MSDLYLLVAVFILFLEQNVEGLLGLLDSFVVSPIC